MTSRTLKQQQGRRLRDDKSTPVVMGYENDEGSVSPVRGDADYPYIIVPPDLKVPQEYRERRTATVDDLLTELNPLRIYNGLGGEPYGVEEGLQPTSLKPIDVRDVRLLTFFIKFFPGYDPLYIAGSVATLTIVPEVAVPPEDFVERAEDVSLYQALDWFPIGVVDPTLRGAYPSVSGYTSLIPPSIAYRDVYETQLNFYGNVAIDTSYAADFYIPQIVLPFDVTPYAFFRLRVGVYSPDASVPTPPYVYVTPTNANAQITYLPSR